VKVCNKPEVKKPTKGGREVGSRTGMADNGVTELKTRKVGKKKGKNVTSRTKKKRRGKETREGKGMLSERYRGGEPKKRKGAGRRQGGED